MRADSVYGFDGDNNPLLRAILRGKLASLYHYADTLRQGAVDRIVALDDAEGCPAAPVPAKATAVPVDIPEVRSDGGVPMY
jgi:hypothetical protein